MMTKRPTSFLQPKEKISTKRESNCLIATAEDPTIFYCSTMAFALTGINMIQCK